MTITNKKIISFTLAKNEEDIIEAFVRHNLASVDHMYVMDNGSTDGTLAILRQLQQEGLALTIIVDDAPAHDQSARVTAFFRTAIEFISFEFIVFLDADEFIFAKPDWLSSLKPGEVGHIERFLHLYPERVTNYGEELQNMSFFANKPQTSKSVYRLADHQTNKKIRIGEGSHHIYLNGKPLKPIKLGAAIRHYAIRSKAQYVRKNLLGWLAMIVRNRWNALSEQPIAVHWRNEFDYIMQNNAKLNHEDVLERLHGVHYRKVKGGISSFSYQYPERKYDSFHKKFSVLHSAVKFSETVSDELSRVKVDQKGPNLDEDKTLDLLEIEVIKNFSDCIYVKSVVSTENQTVRLSLEVVGTNFSIEFCIDSVCNTLNVHIKSQNPKSLVGSLKYEPVFENENSCILCSLPLANYKVSIVKAVLFISSLLSYKTIEKITFLNLPTPLNNASLQAFLIKDIDYLSNYERFITKTWLYKSETVVYEFSVLGFSFALDINRNGGFFKIKAQLRDPNHFSFFKSSFENLEGYYFSFLSGSSVFFRSGLYSESDIKSAIVSLCNILIPGIIFKSNVPGKRESVFLDKNVNKVFEVSLLQKFKNKEKVTIAFLVNDLTKWNGSPLIRHFQKEKKFALKFIVSLSGREQEADIRKQAFNDNFDFFSQIGLPITSLYNAETDSQRQIEADEADILFLQQPWGLEWLVDKAKTQQLLVYMPYGYLMYRNDEMEYNRPRFHPFLWRYFAQSEQHKALCLAHSALNEQNVEVTGYPKLDVYQSTQLTPYFNWPIPTNSKRVIYAPHHALPNETLKISTFDWNHSEILAFAKKYQTVSWVYRPHGRLPYVVERNNVMTTEEYEQYEQQWASLENAMLYKTGEYFNLFKTSDVLITDCSSFLGEYLPTGKPVIWLVSAAPAFELNTVGKLITDAYYKVTNLAELTETFQRVVIEQQDDLKPQRLAVLKQLFNKGYNASAKVVEHISQQIAEAGNKTFTAKTSLNQADYTQMLTQVLLLAKPIAKVALAHLQQHNYPDVNDINFITFNNQTYFGATEDTGYVINLTQGLKKLTLQLDKAKPEYLSLDGIVFLTKGQKIDISTLAFNVSQSSDYKGRQAHYLLQGSRNHTQADLHAWWQVEFAEPLNCDQIMLLNRADIYGKRNNSLKIEAQLADEQLQIEYVDLRHVAFSSLFPPAADFEKFIKSLGFMLYHNTLQLPDTSLTQIHAYILQKAEITYHVELIILAAKICQKLSASTLPLNELTDYQKLINSTTRWEQLAFLVNHLAAFQQKKPFKLTAQGFVPLSDAELVQLEQSKPASSTHINTDNLVKPDFNDWPWPLTVDQNTLFEPDSNQHVLPMYAQSGGAGYFAANSHSAIAHALSLPCSGIELNVISTRCGNLVLHQGEYLIPDYTQDPTGNWLDIHQPIQVSELTLAQLQQYRIGQLPRQSEFKLNYPEWQNASETILTLAQAMALLTAHNSQNIPVVLNLQLPHHATSEQMANYLQQVKQHTKALNTATKLILTVANWQFAQYLKQYWPEQPLWLVLYPAGWLNPKWASAYDPHIAAAELKQIQSGWQYFSGNEPAVKQVQEPLQLLKAAEQLPVDGLSLPLSYLPVVNSMTKPLKLPIFWMAGNERQQSVLQQANKLGTLGMAHYTPCMRFNTLNNAEIKLVESAKTWFKAEKWQEVKTHFSEYLLKTAGECHFDIYYRLAIALRKLELFDESEAVLKQALKFYPNNYRAYIELAAMENQRSNWPQALAYWRRAYLIAGSFSVTSYQRFARAVAANGQTDPLYTQMFNEALETSGTDRIFFICYSFYQILLLVDEGNIAQALKQLSPLTNSYVFTSQDIPHLYLYRNLQLMLHGASYEKLIQTQPQAFNNEIVSDKPTRLMPYDVANLHFVITVLSRQQETNEELLTAQFKQLNKLLEPVVAYAKAAPSNLCHALVIEDQALQHAITALASFIKQTHFKPEQVPGKAWFILGDILLLGFHFDAYAIVRHWAIMAMRAAEPLANYYADTAVKLVESADSAVPADSIVKALAFNGKAGFNQYFHYYRHSNFANYVRQKRIAVVGPVTPDLDQSAEIDSFDLVIRLNFRGKAQLTGKGAGSKTHISYYANDLIDGDNTTPDILEGIAELDWAVFDTETNLGAKGQINNARMHFPYRVYNPLSKGVVNAIQKVLLDLMLYNPAEIKVFNTNLWLSQRNIPGYHVGHARNEVSRFIWHDAKANFVFLQGLWQSGYITIDTMLSQVLTMDEAAYLRALNLAYNPAAQQTAQQG